jgi:5-methylcytosine-specific restriction endonuclease McrA
MPKAYELPAPGEPFDPELFKLGTLCKRNHIHADGLTLRKRKGGYCILCCRIDSYERQKQLRQNPDYCLKQAAYIEAKRKAEGRPSRSKYGLPYTPRADLETRAMRKAIKFAGRLPSVAELVREEQLSYWRKHPADRLTHDRERAKHQARWRHMTDISYRLYHRSKSKRRKAQERGSRTVMLSPDQLWRRWVDFNHTCAYCGVGGDLQVEHVVPISKGGEHHLGNIVPACQSCNFSKRKADVLTWYQSQPFFSETRWHRIQDLLARSQPRYEQPSLL